MESDLLEQQLNELELLRSMFPGVDEFTLEDSLAVRRIEDYVYKRSKPVDPNKLPLISFSISLKIPVKTEKIVTFDLTSTFPRNYPSVRPHLHARCNDCNRSDQENVNTRMTEFVRSLPDGETCILHVIQWLQENGTSFLKNVPEEMVADQAKQVEGSPRKLCRMWFYMHHIYSKQKRKDILSWAEELKVTGFSLPGKPGVVCVEGDLRSVDEYSQRLKAMNWKRITIRQQEVMDTVDGDSQLLKKFEKFEELNFDAHAGGRSRDYHMDLGQFYQYLEVHRAGEMFNVLFGVEGRTSNS